MFGWQTWLPTSPYISSTVLHGIPAHTNVCLLYTFPPSTKIPPLPCTIPHPPRVYNTGQEGRAAHDDEEVLVRLCNAHRSIFPLQRDDGASASLMLKLVLVLMFMPRTSHLPLRIHWTTSRTHRTTQGTSRSSPRTKPASTLRVQVGGWCGRVLKAGLP